MATRELLEGGCHCGGVRFRVAVDEFLASECNCSVCTMKGILHLIVPPERFELLRGRELLSTYTFNTGVARHHFCSVCGIHPFYTPRSDPDKVDVNIRTLDGDAWRRFKLRTFDGKNWEAAQAERHGR
jgi:hypothetical protein